ncbi:hypothetical protein EVAR_95044_1 [Eumeta japonica]|uniref:Uncharacterized protein n=1 Tax=Eumeta variegata TaxID=151549 RepID=A0A4C1SKF7_EUMVA|nr:hypothetical protein EVAR_95044_1 [Eumeta japonica]
MVLMKRFCVICTKYTFKIPKIERLMATFSTLNSCDTLPAAWMQHEFKLHYFPAILTLFLKISGDLSEEQGERFHQDIRTVEERYQGYWNVNIYDG